MVFAFPEILKQNQRGVEAASSNGRNTAKGKELGTPQGLVVSWAGKGNSLIEGINCGQSCQSRSLAEFKWAFYSTCL